MALTSCKECGAQVAASAPTCPKCGGSRPGTTTGKLVIIRSSVMTGAMYAVQVVVDGQLMGKVKNGGTLTVELPAGQRTVKVSGGGMSRDATISIADGKTTRYQMYFSNWGFLGGGLNFKPA
jgi:RNA polymerase subunit RPABC4/transcription elongation factor Spt4